MLENYSQPSKEKFPASINIDLLALKHNISILASYAPQTLKMAVVKANAYGHGLEPVALAALTAGINYLGVAQGREALELAAILNKNQVKILALDSITDPIRPLDALNARETFQKIQSQTGVNDIENISSPSTNPSPSPRVCALMTWIFSADTDYKAYLNANIDLSISSLPILEKILQAAKQTGKRARVHLKIETGMGRAGAVKADYPALIAAAKQAHQQGYFDLVGQWSHLSCGDDPSDFGKKQCEKQKMDFDWGLEQAAKNGVHFALQHLAATSGVLWRPDTHYNMVRLGIGMYGLSPNPAWENHLDLGLKPALSLEAEIISVKKVKAGQTVSYGATWVASEDCYLGIVPLGYADGLARQGSGKVGVYAKGKLFPQLGRICMDQFVVYLGSKAPGLAVGDKVILFGKSSASTRYIAQNAWQAANYPLTSHASETQAQALSVAEGAQQSTNDDLMVLSVDSPLDADFWAAAADTINYTVTTQLGRHLPRKY